MSLRCRATEGTRGGGGRSQRGALHRHTVPCPLSLWLGAWSIPLQGWSPHLEGGFLTATQMKVLFLQPVFKRFWHKVRKKRLAQTESRYVIASQNVEVTQASKCLHVPSAVWWGSGGRRGPYRPLTNKSRKGWPRSVTDTSPCIFIDLSIRVFLQEGVCLRFIFFNSLFTSQHLWEWNDISPINNPFRCWVVLVSKRSLLCFKLNAIPFMLT